jgi:hypothetical protein
MTKLYGPQVLLGNWIPGDDRLGPPPANRPEHGLDLLGGSDSAISAPTETVEDLVMPDLHVQDLNSRSLDSNNGFEVKFFSAISAPTAKVEDLGMPDLNVQDLNFQCVESNDGLEAQFLEVQAPEVQLEAQSPLEAQNFDVPDLGIQGYGIDFTNIQVDDEFIASCWDCLYRR